MPRRTDSENNSDGASHKKLKQQEEKLAHRVRNANSRNLFKAQSGYLSSFATRYIAALNLREVRTRQEARTLAAKVDLWQPGGDRVIVKASHKGNPASYDGCHYRICFSFRTQDRTRQAVITNMLKARAHNRPEQTLLSGGRNVAVKRIRKFYREGFTHVAKMDVSSCYNSFVDPEYVAKTLSIPEQVVRSTMMGLSLDNSRLRIHRDTVKDILCFGGEHSSSIWGRHNNQSQNNRPPNPRDIFQGFFGDDWEIARQGLMQGAKCSGHATEILLAPVCQACTDSGLGQVINYADDFLLMARSQNELLRLTAILALACRRHPAGALRVTRTLSPQREPFEFLGYQFTPGRRNLLKPRWAEKHELKARSSRRRTYGTLHSDADRQTKQRALEDCISFHRNSVRSFPAWVGGADYVEKKLRPLSQLM